MTATIWKFPIPIDDEFEISMPRDAELLFVDSQNNAGQIWARVVPEREREPRRFYLRATGYPVDLDSRHVGSFIIHGGALVFHLFERKLETV
jgi:hypothetical protein